MKIELTEKEVKNLITSLNNFCISFDDKTCEGYKVTDDLIIKINHQRGA